MARYKGKHRAPKREFSAKQLAAPTLVVGIAATGIVSTPIPANAINPSVWAMTPNTGRITKDEVFMWSNGWAGTQVEGSGVFEVYARADTCAGNPQIRVYIDGYFAGTRDIVNTSGSWKYPVNWAAGPGKHTVSINFVNDFARWGCDRNVHIYDIKAPIPNKPAPAPIPKPKPKPPPAVRNNQQMGNFYSDPWYVQQTLQEAAKQPAGSFERKALSALSTKPTSIWLGTWTPKGQVGKQVADTIAAAKLKNQTPQFTLYGMNGCIDQAGGIPSKDYWAWIGEIAWALGENKAIVVIEPDALANAGACSKNITYLKGAVDALSAKNKSYIYMDAGHSNWVSQSTITSRLKAVNITKIRGFALNVANTRADSELRAYGDKLAKTFGLHYVIDTSRNGKPNIALHNPLDAAVGITPQSYTTGFQDASLWIKQPGVSDGYYSGGPNAGVFWAEWASNMVKNAAWRL